jgi:hypothetical protein
MGEVWYAQAMVATISLYPLTPVVSLTLELRSHFSNVLERFVIVRVIGPENDMFLLNICAIAVAVRHCGATRKMQTNFTTVN